MVLRLFTIFEAGLFSMIPPSTIKSMLVPNIFSISSGSLIGFCPVVFMLVVVMGLLYSDNSVIKNG